LATEKNTERATPWHLWAAGLTGIPWNGFGAYDYTMTQIGGEQYLRAFGMNNAQIAYFLAMPFWVTAIWAIGVWGGFLGTLLLLLRHKWALPVFIASFAAFLLSLVYSYVLTNGAEVMDESINMLLMNLVIAAGCVFFIWYSWEMTKRGVLR
jgi:hypothetical protein